MTNAFPAAHLAHIGYNHAYRFDGDQVELEADVCFLEAGAAHTRAWALQLWASSEGFGAGLAQAVKVAELPLQVAGDVLNVSGRSLAMPPAGHAGLRMALALVSWDQAGEAELADLAEYPLAERFFQPRFEGEVQARFSPEGLALTVGGITNPRAEDNLSGTLVLEVWALESAYAGGAWQGQRVVGVDVGMLAGGQARSNLSWTLPAELPVAAPHLTLMLREWTPAGYVTRDFRALPQESAHGAATPAGEALAEPSAKPVTKKAAPVSRLAAKSGSEAAIVNVNTAELAAIDAIKGLSSAVAKAIVAGRPYASLEDLCRVKGMGPKLLEKIRAGLTV